MDRLCFTLTIRQRRCLNGIPQVIDNVYTNVAVNSVIPLSLGYFVTFLGGNNNNATIQISNTDEIPNLIFTIPSGGYKIFDLPTSGGNLRVFIGATTIDCCNTVICCSS